MRAPAKINLGLRIVGRRPDGYHELESLFLPLDLADEVEVEPAPGSGVALRVEGERRGVPLDDSNLAARAARAFAEAAGLSRGVAIRLRKAIPAAAGLGGGSSDAAVVLRALAAAHPGAIPAPRLRALALGLGADVPWFLDPRPAVVRGIGEKIEPVDGVPALALVLASPGVPLATAEVYQAYAGQRRALTPGDPSPTLRALSTLRRCGGRLERVDAGELESWVHNDLEAAAVRLVPAIARLRARLAEVGARAVGLSGSGPTLYGLFADRAAAARAEEALRRGTSSEDTGWTRVAQTLGSP